MGKPREVEGQCPECGETRVVKVYHPHQSPHTNCAKCITAIKDRKFHDDVARRGGKVRVIE